MRNFTTVSICIVMLGATGCGSGDDESRTLSSQAAYQDLFWEYCLPLAEVLTAISDDEGAGAERRAGSQADCPEGGSVEFDMAAGVATLTDCAGAGVSTSGTLNMTLLGHSANFSGGTLTVGGAFAGTATINSGTMSWEVPVADATTYWELNINLDGKDVCIWSGAETGPCPTLSF